MMPGSVNILYVTSEAAPFAKTGGLADVSAALPRYLRRAGHDVRVVMPLYSRVPADSATFEVAHPNLEIRLGPHTYQVSLVAGERPNEPTFYFVHCPALYHRPALYTNDPDEHLRFLVLVRAALEGCQR